MYNKNTHQCTHRFMRPSRVKSAHSREQRPVTSAIHPDRLCQPCILCHKGDLSKYFHPKSWKDPSLLEQLKLYEQSIDIQPESCICRLCRNDVNKLCQEGFVPRWRENTGTGTGTVRVCYIPGCTSTDVKVTKAVSPHELLQFFNSSDTVECNSPEPTGDIPLCSHHYMQWYRHTHTLHAKCKTWEKSTQPQQEPPYTRA